MNIALAALISGALGFTQALLPPMNTPPRSSFGAVTHQGRVYVSGGHQGHEHTYPAESYLDLLEYYEIANQTWHTATPRQYAAHGFGIAGYGDFIYAFGGFAFSDQHKPRWKSLDVIERYDIRNDRWEVIGHMPRARSSNVVAVVGSKAYLIGGWDSTPRFQNDWDGTFHREIDVFDFETETMSTSAFTLPDPLRRALTGVVQNGKILLIGGLSESSSHFSVLDQVTELDPATGSFVERAKLPFPTFAPGAGVIGDSVFVFGGGKFLENGDFTYGDRIYELENDDHAWKEIGNRLTEEKGFPMVVDLNSQTLGILGGHAYKNDTDAPVSTFETFSLSR